MFIINMFNSKHTFYSRVFIETVAQKIDYTENISKQLRSTNILVLIKEVISSCEMSLEREKTIHRLKGVLCETRDMHLHDPILNKCFKDICSYYNGFPIESIAGDKKDVAINRLLFQANIHKMRLENHYGECFVKELGEIDFSQDNYNDSKIRKIKIFASFFVSLLISLGYSKGFIYTKIKTLAVSKEPENLMDFIKRTFFSGPRDYDFHFFLTKDYSQFIKFFEGQGGVKVINDKSVMSLLGKEDAYCLVTGTVSTTDPNSHFAKIYSSMLKWGTISGLIGSSDFNLFINDIDNYSYFGFKNRSFYYNCSFKIKHEIIKAVNRRSSLDFAARKIMTETELLDVYLNTECIKDSLYFYKQAFKVHSLESSISLLWTSLESFLPYRKKSSDIESIQEFVSKIISFGAFSRDIYSIANRVYETEKVFKTGFIDEHPALPVENVCSHDFLIKWFDYFSHKIDEVEEKDPLRFFQGKSDLLLNEIYLQHDFIFKGNISKICDRIDSSKKSITHQIDRVYTHRNKVVHAGGSINDNLDVWNHLEWYVAKLLFTVIYYSDKYGVSDKKNIFMEIEAEVDDVMNIMHERKKEKIIDNKDVIERLLAITFYAF